jgi:beta-lactamase class A
MTSQDVWDVDGVSASWCAAALDGSLAVGHGADELVTPGSVMKVQVALTAASLIGSGELHGMARCRLPAQPRTPGPVGLSLMADEVEMSVRGIWTNRAGPPAACARVRSLMARQLTRQRIASGFGSGFTVAAKSGGLMGIVRNEVGVVTDPAGASYAVAIFTRCGPDLPADFPAIDTAIGRLARRLVNQLQQT